MRSFYPLRRRRQPQIVTSRRRPRAVEGPLTCRRAAVARLFKAYVIVDWSAASKPTTGADSVWIGVMKRDVRFRLTFESFNPATRAAAETQLVAILDDLAKRG